MRICIAVVIVVSSTAAFAQPTGPLAIASAPLVASETLAVQVMLDLAGFSPGEIDGTAGANHQRALRAFQGRHGLPATGRLDPGTWDLLLQVTGDPLPLVRYEISPADVAGPFTPDIPSDLVQQSSLKGLPYRTPLEALAERFHASPALLRALNPGAAFSAAGERLTVPNVVPSAPAPARDPASRRAVTIVVTKSTSALTIEDESGAVLFHAPVTTGSRRDPLPVGTWKVTGVLRNPVFHYNPDLFWDADKKDPKARIAPGPNNPVGVAWIDLDKEHYGIHGTPEPGRVGHTQSHGCVRLTNWDVARVLQWARPGVRVVFRETP